MNDLNDDDGIDFIWKGPLAVMWVHLWEVDGRNAWPAMEKLIQLDDNDISITPKCEIIISDIVILASLCQLNADLSIGAYISFNSEEKYI